LSDIPLNEYIDYTILKPETTHDQVIQVCEEAKQYQFVAVCVNSCFVPLVASLMQGSGVKICSTIGFPLGCTTSKMKAFEVQDAIQNGAQEVDMVINVGALKSGDVEYVERDIAAVVAAARGSALVKVILETCLLTDDEIVTACTLAHNAGADFVKTSTGFNTAGATVEHVALMRNTVGDSMGVKASGGIRTREAALQMIEAGASRIGTSSGVAIMQELDEANPDVGY
jgi:deoxyribose-phosphate aldolase